MTTLTLPFTARSQRDCVLERLTAGPTCSTSLLADGIPRAAARVHELRRAGHIIVTRPCSQGHHHATQQVEYVLLGRYLPARDEDLTAARSEVSE